MSRSPSVVTSLGRGGNVTNVASEAGHVSRDGAPVTECGEMSRGCRDPGPGVLHDSLIPGPQNTKHNWSPVTPCWCNPNSISKVSSFISEHLYNDCVAFNVPLLIATDQFLFVKTDPQFGRRDIENCFRGSGDHFREEIFTVIFINLTKEEALQQCNNWWLDDFWFLVIISKFQHLKLQFKWSTCR